MPIPFRFSMHPKDDLSTRTDFTYDLMQDLAKEVKLALDGCEALSGIREKAKVDVKVTGTLRNVLVDVKVVPNEGVAIEESELVQAHKDAGAALDAALKEKMGEIIQGAIDSARGRM